ncbi:MAG: hypothetical protein JWP69_1712 [Flaviaesturariibacter sp.]|nr:hypothetical protein [Flaviaesturariibacter sp.]
MKLVAANCNYFLYDLECIKVVLSLAKINIIPFFKDCSNLLTKAVATSLNANCLNMATR